jgi:hypothetical protein
MRPREPPLLLLIVLEKNVVMQLDCHPEQAFFAQSCSLVVIPNKRSLRGEESGRAA